MLAVAVIRIVFYLFFTVVIIIVSLLLSILLHWLLACPNVLPAPIRLHLVAQFELFGAGRLRPVLAIRALDTALVFNEIVNELDKVLVLQVVKVLAANGNIVKHVVQNIHFHVLLHGADCLYKLRKIQDTLLLVVLAP